MPCSIFLHVLQTKSSKVCFLNSQDRFSCDCNESDPTVGTTVLIPSTWLRALALPLSWLRRKKTLSNHVFPSRFMWCLLSFVQRHKICHLFFYLPCFTSDWNIYFPHFYMILRSYATDSTVLIMMYYMTLVGQHCNRSVLHFLVIMNLSPCFSCHLSPTSCFLSTGCLSKLHGNRKGWEIVLVLLFCGKQLSTWCLYSVPFLVIKIHFKKMYYILCVFVAN